MPELPGPPGLKVSPPLPFGERMILTLIVVVRPSLGLRQSSGTVNVAQRTPVGFDFGGHVWNISRGVKAGCVAVAA